MILQSLKTLLPQNLVRPFMAQEGQPSGVLQKPSPTDLFTAPMTQKKWDRNVHQPLGFGIHRDPLTVAIQPVLDHQITTQTSKTKVHYDLGTWLYGFYHKIAMHYGIWESGYKEDDAMQESARLLWHEIKDTIKDGDVIVDAGCGRGSVSLYLAQRLKEEGIRATVKGVTISGEQVELANKNAVKAGLQDWTEFVYGDFKELNVPDDSIAAIVGVESALCYSAPDFVSAFAHFKDKLKGGGQLLLFDGYYRREFHDYQEYQMSSQLLGGWFIYKLGWSQDFVAKAAAEAGLSKLFVKDFTHQIKPSVKKLNRLLVPVGLPLRLLKRLNLIQDEMYGNVLSVMAQGPLYDQGLFGYGFWGFQKL